MTISRDEAQQNRTAADLVNAALDRRSLLKVGAILGTTGMMAIGTPVFAQDATPEATPAADATPVPLPKVPPEIEAALNDWPMAQQNYAATRHAPSSTIDSSNVDQLGVAWELPIEAEGVFGVITSNPIVLGNRVYVVDNSSNVYAVDFETGETIWRVEHNIATDGPNGVFLGYGKLFVGLGDKGSVIALDPETGETIWETSLTAHFTLGINQAPIVHDGVVIVSTAPGGNTKGRYGGGANGVVYAMDAEDGEVIWTWDTVEEDLWGNFRVNSGGGLWYPPAIDTETGILYMGIGNAAPFPGFGDSEAYPNLASRPGENLYANCLVALDPTQGRVLWWLNVKPRDYYDHDNQQSPVLGTVNIGGGDADVVFTSGKHGYVAAVHRGSGQEIWRRAVGIHLNDGLTSFPEDEVLEVYPGIWGGVQSPLAFADGIVYGVAFNWSTSWTATEYVGSGSGEGGLGVSTATVFALDGASGEFLWNTDVPIGVTGSGPVISNDLLFIGSLDGIVRAYTRADGTQVWTSQTAAGINAPFAIVKDTLLVPAGTAIIPSVDSPAEVPGYNGAVIAYRLGATGEVTFGESANVGENASEEGGSFDTAVTVSAFDLSFTPSSFTIPADTDITITVTNDGNLQHDLRIEDTDFGTALIAGGGSEDVVVNLPAGEYTFICTVEGHAAAGMVGTITVQ